MTIDLNKTPALRYLLYFCLGLILNSLLSCKVLILVILLFVDLCFILILRQHYIQTYFLLICIILSGMLRISLADAVYAEKLKKEFVNQEKNLTVLQLKSNPFYIKSYTVETLCGKQKIKGTLYAKKTLPVLIPGRRYKVNHLDCKPIEAQVNPYVFDYKNYAKSKGISHSFKTNKGSNFEDLGVEKKVRYQAYKIRTDISTRYLSVLGIEKGSLVNGLLLGLKSEIPENLASLFKKMGISHLLAVSGLHVGLIMMIIYQLLQVMGLSRIPRTLIIIGFLVFYCVLTGASASVVRSSLMSAMLLFAPILKRKYHAMNAVAATALILLLINPFALKDVGFQFSFSAVFGILIAYPKFRALLNMKNKSAFIVYIWEMLAVSFSAALFTAPVAMFYFNSLQLGSMALNCLVIPLTFVVMISAIICLPCLYLPSFISDLFLHALDLFLDIFRTVLRISSRSGIWTLQISSYWKALFLCGFVFLLIFIIFDKKKIRWIITTACVLSFSLMFLVQTRAELLILALEKGQCAIYRKGQKALLVNTGAMKFGSNDYDRNIKAILEHFGIRNVDILITEDTKKKTANISSVKRDFPMCRVYTPGIKNGEDERENSVKKDTSIVFANERISLDYENGTIDVYLCFSGDSLILKNSDSDSLGQIGLDAKRETAIHYRSFGKFIQEVD